MTGGRQDDSNRGLLYLCRPTLWAYVWLDMAQSLMAPLSVLLTHHAWRRWLRGQRSSPPCQSITAARLMATGLVESFSACSCLPCEVQIHKERARHAALILNLLAAQALLGSGELTDAGRGCWQGEALQQHTPWGAGHVWLAQPVVQCCCGSACGAVLLWLSQWGSAVVAQPVGQCCCGSACGAVLLWLSLWCSAVVAQPVVQCCCGSASGAVLLWLSQWGSAVVAQLQFRLLMELCRADGGWQMVSDDAVIGLLASCCSILFTVKLSHCLSCRSYICAVGWARE
jgi:hypothetical protein